MALPISRPDSDIVLPPRLRSLADKGVIRRYRAGQRLIEEGDTGDTLYIILGGRLRAFGTDARGREITYGTYGAGEYVGEMSLDGGRRSASVEVAEPCECAVVARTTLLEHIAEYPEFAFDLMSKVIRRARSATLTAKQMALNDVYGRLVILLDLLAVADDDGSFRIQERLTHKDIASRIGCSREMVSRILKDLESGGYVHTVGARLAWRRPLPPRW